VGGNPHITDLVFTITEADITTGCDQASIKAPAGFVKMIHASSRKAPLNVATSSALKPST
jgi:hypothetical protein